MANQEILGVSFDDLVEPTRIALREYIDMTDERFSLGSEEPGKLGDTGEFAFVPEKPNTSARLAPLDIYDFGERVGSLVVIAFAPQDGTGDTSLFGSTNLMIPEGLRYDTRPDRVYPRDKDVAGVGSEVHLTIASIDPNSEGREPRLFAGRLGLFEPIQRNGKRFPDLEQTGTLGQRFEQYVPIMNGKVKAEPTATMTTMTGQREFGRRHSVVNKDRTIQLAAFWAIQKGENVSFPNEWRVKMPFKTNGE